MDEGSVDRDVTIPPHADATEVSKPGDRSLDLPSPAIASQRSTVLVDPPTSGQVWGNQLDPALQEPATEWQRVVASIADEAVRVLTRSSRPMATYSDRRERLRCKLGLTRASAMEGNSQRKTLAVCQYHELCAFALPGLSDVETPFLPAQRWRP